MRPHLQNAPNESDIEDLGVFEYLDDEAPHFVAAPPSPPPRVVHDPVLAARLRLELPMLWAWLFLTCFFADAGPWVLWGAALIAVNAWLRPAYAQHGLHWLFRIYVGVGLGQIVLALARITNFTAIQPVVGLGILILLMVWIVLELRYQSRLPVDPIAPSEDDQVYYFYGR